MANATVKLGDVEHAFECVNAGGYDEINAWIDRDNGAIFIQFPPGMTDEEPEFPDDIDTNDRYVVVPGGRDLDLGTSLVMRFAHERMPEHADTISDIFHRRGAYRRFKDFLDQQDRLGDWCDYERQAKLQALREWCKDNGIAVVE